MSNKHLLKPKSTLLRSLCQKCAVSNNGVSRVYVAENATSLFSNLVCYRLLIHSVAVVITYFLATLSVDLVQRIKHCVTKVDVKVKFSLEKRGLKITGLFVIITRYEEKNPVKQLEVISISCTIK